MNRLNCIIINSRYRLIGTVLCLMSVSIDARADYWSVILEAEEAQIIEPARAISANGARGGYGVLMSKDGLTREVNRDAAGSLGKIFFEHEIPSPGEYQYWGRIKWHCTCSRSIKVDSTSSSFLSGNGGALSSYAQPREWIWMKLGAGFFEPGKHEIGIVPIGHMFQIDALAISDDPGYTPPGFSPANDVRAAANLASLNWESTPTDCQEEMESHIFEGTEWMNFQLDFAVPIPAFVDELHYAVNLCEQTEGSKYALRIAKSVGKQLTLTFQLQDNENNTPLMAPIKLESDSDWLSLSIMKFDTQMRLGVNGVMVGTMYDDTLPAGRTRFLKPSAQELGFEEVSMRRLRRWVEIFDENAPLWQSSGGQWKLVADRSESEVSGFMGHTNNQAYCLAPWDIGGTFSMTADVNVLNGAGGVAFNIASDKNYWAVRINLESGASSRKTLQLVHVNNDRTNILWEIPMIAEGGQWHKLELNKGMGTLTIVLNGERIAYLKHKDWATLRPVGLYLDSDSTAYWGKIEVRDPTEFPKDSLLFEPYCDNTSLSQWRVEAGSARLNGHPAVLILSPDAQLKSTEMTLRRTLPTNSRITLRLERPNDDSSSADNETEDFILALPMPRLPGEPRIGLRFTPSHGDGPTYTAWLDYPSLTYLTIMRNNEILGNKLTSQILQAEAPTFFFELRHQELFAGVNSGVKLKIIEHVNVENLPMQVSVITESLKGNQPLQIAEIQVENIAKIL